MPAVIKKGHIPWNKGLHVANNNVFCKGNNLGVANKGKPKSKLHKKKLRIAHLGKKASDKTKKLMSKQRSGENGYQWKGDEVGYFALHNWVRRERGKAEYCEHCGKESTISKYGRNNIQWANKSHKYLRKKTDWISLCISCHKKYDRDYKRSLI